MHLFGSGQLAGSCEYGTELSVLVKCEELFDHSLC